MIHVYHSFLPSGILYILWYLGRRLRLNENSSEHLWLNSAHLTTEFSPVDVTRFTQNLVSKIRISYSGSTMHDITTHVLNALDYCYKPNYSYYCYYYVRSLLNMQVLSATTKLNSIKYRQLAKVNCLNSM